MNLASGAWEVGVWAPTVWAQCVWSEPGCDVAPEPEVPQAAFITSRRQGRTHRISGRLVGQGSVVTGEISVLPTGQDDIDLTALSV